MPLTAMVDGEMRISSLLDDAAWARLRADVRDGRSAVAMRCGRPGYLRTSASRTHHFVHGAGGDGCTTQESWQHLLAKAEIVNGIVAAGWKPEPEAPGDGWVADVLASNDDRRAVFEVQWSAQAPDVYRDRQRRYDNAGIDTVTWFARHLGSAERAGGLRALSLDVSVASGPMVVVDGARRPLAEIVRDMLTGSLVHRDFVSGDHPSDVRIGAAAMDCYRCPNTFGVWAVTEVTVLGRCGAVATREYPPVPVMELHRYEEVPELRSIGEQLARELGLEPAGLDVKWSSTARRRYRAFTCPSCGALSGEFFVHTRFDESAPDAEVDAVGPAVPVHHPHWCVDDGEGVCGNPAAALATALAADAVASSSAGDPQASARSSSISEAVYIVSGMRMMNGSARST